MAGNVFSEEPKQPPKELAVDVGNGVKLEMVLIRAGEFMMGSPDSDKYAYDSEKPQHRVRITKPFYLGRYLVTQQQWKAVTGKKPSHFKGPKNPLEQVSWDDCQAFVEKLNGKVGGGKFSLPTEAQWEYACRAGSTTTFFFGEEGSGLDEYAWYDTNSDQKTHPVGEKKSNAWGLYDMYGNVWEWCQDRWDEGYYAKSPTDDPTGPATGSGRITRGGGWVDHAVRCRSAYRVSRSPDVRDGGLGLRVARFLVEPVAGTPSPESIGPLKLQPVPPQTVEAGRLLTVMVSVEDAQRWKGKLRYSLASHAPPEAKIDPRSGEFSWTPPPDQSVGKCDVTVSAQGPDGQTAQTTLVITVLKELTVDLGHGVKLEMVLIPAGEFLMGSSAADKSDFGWEKPQHRVRITKPFYLGKYLVTQEQWESVMRTNPSSFKGPKNPVEMVSWDDCQVFLGRLNWKLGVGQGKFELPTEAQWEYACRAGSTARYCFGDDGDWWLGDYAWYDENSSMKTHPVGGKKANAWGLYDMHGNVWEWCADWYDDHYYAGSLTDDPKGPATGSKRVLRGGGWDGNAGCCRLTYRCKDTPEVRAGDLGLRLVRVPAEK
jgi:formylglycine-generating enzyme required for sulfatase activity